MAYKYDNKDIPFVAYVTLSHPEIRNISIKNNPFNDGGKTRTFMYFGIKGEGANEHIAVGYPSKRILYQYTEESYRSALVASFVFILN